MSRRLCSLGVCAAFAMALLPGLVCAADNELTEVEKKEGYQLLFNGKDFTGWHRTTKGFDGWEVQDGALVRVGKGGYLWSDKQYGDFVLKVEYKCSPGCNSGIFIRTKNPKDPVQTGMEIQVFDDGDKEPDKHTNGALYDLVAPSKKAAKKAGEWNSAVITCQGSTITVEMNGEKIVEADLDQWTEAKKNPDGTKNKFKTAYKDMPREGYLGLQDHGKQVWFKNLKLKPLK